MLYFRGSIYYCITRYFAGEKNYCKDCGVIQVSTGIIGYNCMRFYSQKSQMFDARSDSVSCILY